MPGSRIEGLRQLRVLAGLSVAQVARLAHVSDRLIHQLESGGTAEPRDVTRILAVVAATAPPPAPVIEVESESRGVVESEEKTDGRDTTDRD